jgi:hypothetical protein
VGENKQGLENKAAIAEPFLEADSPWLKSVTGAWQVFFCLSF